MSEVATGHDADLERRFGGLERLYGLAGAQRIRAAHVAVIGIGGVGSWAAEALARSGVGTLTLVDMDHVAESNINRQVHALGSTLGQAKVDAMRERIRDIHPGCEVRGIDAFVEPSVWPALLGHSPDAVIDACDQVTAKTAMAAWARAGRRPFVMVGAAGGKREAQRVAIADLSRCTHDPLLARVRNRLRHDHGAPREGRPMGIECVFSEEPVAQVDPSCDSPTDGSLNCHGYGSVVAVTAVFGMVAAGRILQSIANAKTSAASLEQSAPGL